MSGLPGKTRMPGGRHRLGRELQPWAPTYFKLTVEIVKRPHDPHTFEALPRRCARDYERLPASHEAAVHCALITAMTRCLTRPG
jgi:hypothetical protein